MSRNYDNWERLVDAVLRKELIWKICHEDSRTPSPCSSFSSDFSSFSRPSFQFPNPETDLIFKYAPSLPFQIFVEEKRGRLELLDDSPVAFSLEELLMAPFIVLGAELPVLTYTFVLKLKEDTVFVAKRLIRDDTDSLSLFERNVKNIGCIEHENIVKLRGFYWSESKCFGFYNYFPQGSVYTMLHGRKGEDRAYLDWETRMRIAVGAARGLAHIHTQWNGKLLHGNVKASNIFLNPQQYGCLADHSIFATVGISSYVAPEALTTKKLSQKSDVYSFGILLIELLSGKSPLRFSARNRTFADWACHIAGDEWSALVFDKGLLKDPVVKQGMWDMLAVALRCLNKKPEVRPNMSLVLEELEVICTELGV